MKYFELFFTYVVAILLVSFLVSNMMVSVQEKDYRGLFAMRNIFLLSYILIVCYRNRFSTLLLICLNLIFWYKFFTIDLRYSSWCNDPILCMSLNLELWIDKDYIKYIPVLFAFSNFAFYASLFISVVLLPYRIARFWIMK
ncbi:hypothetical protein AD998_15115 [bacterium 336/3]|nr:hypothetical protein AD998_15115 [bacterium 336/3]